MKMTAALITLLGCSVVAFAQSMPNYGANGPGGSNTFGTVPTGNIQPPTAIDQPGNTKQKRSQPRRADSEPRSKRSNERATSDEVGPHPEQACLEQRNDQPADLDKRIAACSRLIADSTVSIDIRAGAYMRRARAYAQKAEIGNEKDNLDRAIADLSEIIRLTQNNPLAQRYAYQLRAGLLFIKGDYDRALADQTMLIKLEPQSATAYHYRGIINADKGSYDSAIADFSESIRLVPNFAESYSQRALAYLHANKLDQALADANQAIALDRNNSASYAARIVIYRALGLNNEVIGDLRKVSALDPSNEGVKQELKRAEAAQVSSSAKVVAPAPIVDSNLATAARRDYELASQVGTRKAWEAFLKQYQTGFYVDLAREQLSKLADGSEREAERAKAEGERPAQEQAERERVEKERLAREQAERERLEKERKAREQAETERLEKERRAREQAERERLEKDRIARNQAERDKQEQERAAREKLEREKAIAEAAAKSKIAALTPANETPPTTVLAGGALVTEIKKELKRVGCYTGPIDDQWATTQTSTSIKKFVRAVHDSGVPEQPTMDFLNNLRGKSEHVCPPECGKREVESRGQCVAKTCADGYGLDEGGDCVRQKEHSRTSTKSDEPTRPRNKSAKVTSTSREEGSSSGGIACGRFGCSPTPKNCRPAPTGSGTTATGVQGVACN